MNANVSIIVSVFCFVISALPLDAQWIQTNGPYGGEITSLVGGTNRKGSRTFLALTLSRELYVSTDGCQNWTVSRNGLASDGIWAAAIVSASDSIHPPDLFVGTSRGVYHSNDHGLHWTLRGLPGKAVFLLASASCNDSQSLLVAGTLGGVFRSTDLGISWEQCKIGFDYSTTVSPLLAVSLASDQKETRLLAGFGEPGGVLRSTDCGENWTISRTGLPRARISGLVTIGRKILASSKSGVFRSNDLGESWSPVKTDFGPKEIYSLCALQAQDAQSGTQILAGTDGDGVFLSADDGSSWKQIDSGLTSKFGCRVVAFPAGAEGAECYVANMAGVFQLQHGGHGWIPANNGLINTSVFALAEDVGAEGRNSGIIYAGTGSGLFLSADEGNTWRPGNKGLSDRCINAIRMSGGNVYIGTDHGAFLSTDRGESWTSIGLSDEEVSSILLEGSTIIAGTWSGVYISSDGGQHWTLSLKKFVWSLDSTPGTNGTTNVFAGTMEGVYLSCDNGSTWSATALRGDVKTLARRGTTVFAATRGGGDVIVRDNVTGKFTLKKAGEVFVSTNNGTQWQQLSLSGFSIESFAFKDTIIFAGLLGGGVVASYDSGKTWLRYEEGLTTKAIESLLVSGSHMYLGARNAGVWRRSLADKP